MPEITNEVDPIEMDKMVDTNEREPVLERQTSTMNAHCLYRFLDGKKTSHF
jgi:hypothetical protein